MNILFVFAHPDDEAFGPAGTIAKLSSYNKTGLLILCDGARPGHECVKESRQQALTTSCKLLGVGKIGCEQLPDLSLNIKHTISQIESVIREVKPNIVYTHNITDINSDHRIVAEACLVACRPKPDSCVKQLYFCENMASTSWTFHQILPTFEPNVYVDITDTIMVKEQVLELYKTETYSPPDARSVGATITLAEHRGNQVGVQYAEAFKLVFSIS